MRILSCFIFVLCINFAISDDASAASRRGTSGKSSTARSERYIEPNIRFYENFINSRVGKNASPAAKFFAHVDGNGH